jgi:hypothetical protein
MQEARLLLYNIGLAFSLYHRIESRLTCEIVLLFGIF